MGQTDDSAPIARVRAADIYAYGDGLVVRRYRTPYDGLHEAAVMQYVREHGYPVPDVVEVTGGDMVMERVDGPTMLPTSPAGRGACAGTHVRSRICCIGCTRSRSPSGSTSGTRAGARSFTSTCIRTT